MIVYKISLNMSGENFTPKVIEKLVNNKLYVESIYEIGDITLRLGSGREIIAKTNAIGIQHKDLIAIDNEKLIEFEKTFVDFLQKNCNEIEKANVDDIDIDIDIYTSNDICSLSIFDKNQLKILTDCTVSINLTYYRMKKKKIKEIWEV